MKRDAIPSRGGLPRAVTAAYAALSLTVAAVACAASPSADRHTLQQQQLQDALDLSLQQSGPRSRSEMSPSDTLRLDQLQLRQRMELQQLEQHQLQRQRLSSNRDDRDGWLQQGRFALERQLQIQRFDMEQRELLRSTRPRPLQRPSPRGALQP